MNPVVISRRFEFDTGHRLMKHGGKCQNYHGHRYAIELHTSFDSPGLDDQGMVVDFSEIKRVIGGWLDEYWDHGMILERGDPFLDLLEGQAGVSLPPTKVFITDYPPTVENLVALFAETAQVLLAKITTRLRVVRVVMWETPACKAEYTP